MKIAVLDQSSIPRVVVDRRVNPRISLNRCIQGFIDSANAHDAGGMRQRLSADCALATPKIRCAGTDRVSEWLQDNVVDLRSQLLLRRSHQYGEITSLLVDWIDIYQVRRSRLTFLVRNERIVALKVGEALTQMSQLSVVQAVVESLGYDAQVFNRGKVLLPHLRRDTFDLIIVDERLRDMGGMEVIAWIRSNLDHWLPILLISDRYDEESVAAALSAGADEYLVKPVRAGELRARLAALLRRFYFPATSQPTFGAYSFFEGRFSVRVGEQLISLANKEFELARIFFANVGRPLTRSALIDRIDLHHRKDASMALDNYITKIRKKLDLSGRFGYRIRTIYGYGYCLDEVPRANGIDPDEAA